MDDDLEFEWDDDKAAKNLAKHGVDFLEAKTAFKSTLRIDFDPFHSTDEDRYILIGISEKSRRLFVSHTYREGRIRLIMARVMTGKEWERYEKSKS